jgi:hypothetical protein
LGLAANGAARPISPRSAGSHRIWSAIAAAAAIALVAGAVIWVRGAAGTGEPPISRHRGVYTDPKFGWTIRYPPGLLVEHYTAQFRWTLDGIRVTNFAPDLGHRTGQEPEMGWLRSFPASGVAAQIWYLGGPAYAAPARSSRFPLRASSFHRVRPYAGGPEPAPAYRSFSADGYGFNAAVWAGPHASQADKRAIWHVIRSLRFPRLRQGTSFNGSVYVLGPAADYPAGSVTGFAGSTLPTIARPRYTRGFYLVHTSRGFYVVDRFFLVPTRPAAPCTVAFDRASSLFYCPGTKLRWNVAGRHIRPPGPRYAGWDLPLGVAAISTDGHILVSPSFGRLGL